jgi:methylenetetrahydrofolate reductase (NADPH)
VEFFPPKTPQGEENLQRTIDALEGVRVADGTVLSFVSITYGAGGSTRDKTRDLVVGVNAERSFPAMPHLTCVGHTKAEIADLLADYADNGVHNILALGGDLPADGSNPTGDFNYACELIEAVQAAGDFAIGVAAHPEMHPRSTSNDADRRRLAEKLAVADFGITQFFFDSADYFRMVEELDALGCNKPVLPGVMPLLNPTTVERFAKLAKARFPDALAERVLSTEDPAERLKIAAEAAAGLIEELINGGVPGIHLYCLNRSDIVEAVLEQVPALHR